MTEGWVPDVLGKPFEQLTLPLPDDDEGAVVATLVRLLPRRSLAAFFTGGPQPFADVDVLYLHGWSDYFFQTRLARFWVERGARFYALDLRKYGRSLRAGQTPGYIGDLADYDPDIAAALTAMGRRADGTGERRLVLFGHSTGGLTASLWAARHPDAAAAIVLNSPWLEFQLSASVRQAITPVLDIHSRRRPLDLWPQVDGGFYARAQAEVADPDDPVQVDPAWRPERSLPVHVGWMRAIVAGHAAVSKGLGISAPVCVLLSARSVAPTRWDDELTRADSVLVVDDIARAALRLGSSVTIERIDGALHDVFLSRPEARAEAYERMGRWTTAMLSR
ncbi:alpha-beta hydrolase superfamily lysophospholipase [Microbacterium sp. AK009]|uniref:alpha/beta hydrolase n=1 Tax=Microbacterium sp. AK009 TaxID=2723068 RepID=UPI0015CE90D2|nr:alpha/beta hydrolase [Microbacterium sp. AK009]NYF17775.1 alpha-beta hydrolase superfamily lysophospholipase [Microbacterium sp. AK009]